MSVLDDLLFTEMDLKLSEFVEQFRSQFPVILIAKTGIDHSDDPLHSVSAEEMYWINGIQRQKRIVAADIKDDEHRRYFSIPLDYHRKFQWVGTKEILGPPEPMHKIVEGTTKFVFANGNNIGVNFEGSNSRRVQIGTLKVIDVYEQKYLVGHSLYENVMDMTPSSIPVYLDIMVEVATGFNGENDATFTEWMRLVNELGRCNQRTRVKTCGEIIQFREMPECGNYDIQPLDYLKTHITRNQKPETNSASPSTINDIRRSSSAESRPTCESDEDISTAPPIPEGTYGTKRLPPIPRHIPASQTVVGKRTEHTLARPKELTKNSTTGIDTTFVDAETDHSLPTPTHLLQFNHISEVPPNMDLSSLSVTEFTHCLSLLGLSKYSDIFQENDVDGKLASELSIQILVKSFGFSDFDAMKFTKFLKGWRPNLK